MMDGMSIELAEKVHLLFMNNYINYSIPDGVTCFVGRRISIMTMGNWRNARCGRQNDNNVSMTQDERWQAKYNEVVEFININHRNPSKHRIEEHNMLNWILCCI